MHNQKTRVFGEIDYEKNGLQIGHLCLEHSVTRSANGLIRIPVACIRRGAGPTALLIAGNHGDEFEGPIALANLTRRLATELEAGRVIILPTLNMPAVLEAARVSSLDSVNLNRCFPGAPDATPTPQIAHYVDSVLIPICDVVVDLHSGGTSFMCLPFASVGLCGRPQVDEPALRYLRAFAAPHSLVFDETGGTLSSAARARNVPAIGTELGGAGMLSPAGVKIAEDGVLRILVEVGMIDPKHAPRPVGNTTMVEMRRPSLYLFSDEDGVFEPVAKLGDTVTKGDLAGHLHFIRNLWQPPRPMQFADTGIVVGLRPLARVLPGDCIAHLATISAEQQ